MDTIRWCAVCNAFEMNEHEHLVINKQCCPCEIYGIASDILSTSISKTLNSHEDAKVIGKIQRPDADVNVGLCSEDGFVVEPRTEAKFDVGGEQIKSEEESGGPTFRLRNFCNHPMKWRLLKSSFVFCMGMLTVWNGELLAPKLLF